MIYSDLESARSALAQFTDALQRMQTEMGISLEIEDSCDRSWWVADYYDTDGNVKRFFYDP